MKRTRIRTKVGNGNNDAMPVYYYESNTPSMAQPYISAISLQSSSIVTRNAIDAKSLNPAKTNSRPFQGRIILLPYSSSFFLPALLLSSVVLVSRSRPIFHRLAGRLPAWLLRKSFRLGSTEDVLELILPQR